MTAIYDRMESSCQRPNFFDKTEQSYFVIYTVEELADTLNVGTSTIKRTMKSLIKAGWLYTKRLKSRANAIFISSPHRIFNNESEQQTIMTPSNGSNRSLNQINFNQTNNKTINTAVNRKSDYNHQVLSSWQNQLHVLNTKTGLPETALKLLTDFCNDNQAKFSHYVKSIFIAKAKIKTQFNNQDNVDQILTFETNPTLGLKVTRAINAACLNITRRGLQNGEAYFMTVMLNLFKTIVQRAMQAHQYSKNLPGKERKVKEQLPDWAKEGFVPTPKSAKKTVSIRAELSQNLAKLQALRAVN
ncbi:hypothetical protein ACI3E1_07110 [Ligilactobacillus sp. LYQ139]